MVLGEVKNQVVQLLDSINTLSNQIKASEDKLNGMKSSLIGLLQMDNTNKYEVKVNYDSFGEYQTLVRANVIAKSTVAIDELGLLNDIGSEVYDTLVEKKINHKLLQQAVEEGIVDADIVHKHTTVKEGKPYVKITSLDRY